MHQSLSPLTEFVCVRRKYPIERHGQGRTDDKETGGKLFSTETISLPHLLGSKREMTLLEITPLNLNPGLPGCDLAEDEDEDEDEDGQSWTAGDVTDVTLVTM